VDCEKCALRILDCFRNFPFELDFEMRIDPIFEGDANHRKGDATTIQFVLIDKEGQTIRRLGQCFLDVIVRSTKNHNKTLSGKIIYDHESDKPRSSKEQNSSQRTQADQIVNIETTAIDLVPYYHKLNGIPLDKRQSKPFPSLPTNHVKSHPHNPTEPTVTFGSPSILPPLGTAISLTPRALSPMTLKRVEIPSRDSRTHIRNLLHSEDRELVNLSSMDNSLWTHQRPSPLTTIK